MTWKNEKAAGPSREPECPTGGETGDEEVREVPEDVAFEQLLEGEMKLVTGQLGEYTPGGGGSWSRGLQ